MSLMGYVASIA